MSARRLETAPAPEEEALLRLECLVAGYEQPVVGPLSFELRRGEAVGVTGPNGCGKSTLLRALTGGARIHSGRALRAPGLRISHQQQSFDRLEGFPLCGRELLALTGALEAGLPPWLRDRLGQRLDRLSGGQLQFLRLWACLMAPADLVLLDEPTNNLDREGVAFLVATLKQTDPRRALIVVSHDAPFVRAVCAQVLEVGQ